MAESEVANLPTPLPDTITISGDPSAMRWTPNEMRALKAASGRTMTELLGEGADDADRMQALVWLRLYQDGHQPDWEAAGDVAIVYQEAPEPDPTTANG
jgi:hypothetical protein